MAFVLNAKLNLLAPNNVAIIANQIRKELNSVSSVGLNVVAPTNMKSIVGQINADLKKVNRNIRINVNAKTMTTSIEKIKQATGATEKLSKSVEGLGFQTARSIRHYAGFALTTSSVIKLAAAFSAGVGDAVKYDRELVRISQVTGQSLSGLKDLSREVTRLSTSFGVSSEKILESAVTLSQAGLSAKDTKVALEALAKTGLSATFGDITGTTEAAIAIMQQFGYQAKDLEGILGSVNAVSAAFAVESEDIAVAVRRSGGALQAAGVNFHEFGALLTSVRQTTRESAESIATGFRTIFARLQRSRTQDFLKNLGIDVLNDDGLFVGGYEAIKRISAALKEVSTVDPRFSQIVEELGGFRQVSKVIPLIEKFDVAEKALNVSLRGGNSLTKDAATAQQSLEVQFTKTREAFLALVRDIINEDSFKTLIRGTLEVANAFIKVGDSIKDIIPLLGLIGLASFVPKAPSYKTGFIKGLFGNNKTEKFASGGYVPGSGNGDTVPALLTPGEFVIRKSAAKSIGYDKLNQMNKYATGGKVGLRNRKLGPLKTNLVNVYEPITDDENNSINDYGAMGFYQINGLLRGNVAKRSGPGVELLINKENFIRRANDIKNIDKIITKSVINRDTTLYRGIGDKRLKAIEDSIGTRLDSPDAAGRIFVDKGFVSTSRDKNVGRGFGELGRLFYINVKKGQKATTVIPHGDTSEQEILLPRNSAFKVIRKRLLELVNPVFPVPPINSKQSEAQSRFGKIRMNKYARGGMVRKYSNIPTNNYEKLGISPDDNVFTSKYEPNYSEQIQANETYVNLGAAINQILRGNRDKKHLNLDDDENLGDIITHLDSSIMNSVMTRRKRLFRGISLDAVKDIEKKIGYSLDDKNAIGKRFTDSGYTSTSLSKMFAKSVGERLMVISVEKGQSALIPNNKGFKNQQEILLPRESDFRITGIGNKKEIYVSLENLPFTFDKIYSKKDALNKKSVVKRNSGGAIPGQGDSDSVPSLLTPGEFVINKKAAKNIGYATLNNMNRQGKVKKYNKGGLVGNIVSRVKDNPLGALTLVTAGATTLANMIGDTNSALSELTQTALNAAVQFGIASTVLTKGGDLLSRQLTAHPEIDKYTKTGKQNAANNIKNADISYMPEVQAYRKRATEKMAKSFTDRADYQQTGRTHKEDLQEFDNESHFKANKAARQFAGLREKDLFAQGFNPKDPDIQAETNRLAELKRQAVFKRESGKTRTEIKTVSRYRKASPQEDGNNHFNAQIESSKFYMAHEDRLKAQGVDTNDPKVRDELERLSALKQKAAYKRATRKSEFYTTTERKQVSRQGIVNDYKKRLANTASELSANPGAQYMIDEDVKGFSNNIKNSDEFKPQIERKLAAQNKLNNIRRLKMLRGTAIGGAIAGVAGNIGGQYLQNRGSEEIANGSTSTVKSTTGGAISGAASYGALGAQVGAIGGPWGIAIGAGVGAIVGALKGGADALAEAEKQIRAVKLDKDLVNLGRKLNSIANGTSSARGSSMDVTTSISSAFKDISSLSGNERTDAISKFKNNNAAIESFYTEIAKNSSSLEDFNKVTGNSLIQFAAISDIGFTELVTSVNSTIKAEIKAKEALDKMSAAAAVTADSQAVLEAFVTAIASASTSLETFDRNLDRIESGISFSGANLKSQSAGTIFKAAAGGRFTDANKVADISSNLTSQFGGVGQVVAKQTGDIAKARQLIPDIIKEFANSPFSEDRTPQGLAEKKLKSAGISDGVIQQVLAGITNSIGNESNQANLAKKFAANPNDTANDIFKTLTPTIEAMGDFANKISEHNNRIGRLFDISSKIQAKINSMQLEQESKLTDLLIKIKEDNGGILSLGTAQNLDKQKVAAISGTPGIAVNSNTLFNRASNAKSNIKSLDEIISQKELDGLNVDAEIQARQENIDVLTKSSAALEEMTKNGYEYAAIEKALSKASNERRFRKDALNLQTFGSKADKDKEAKTIATVLALKNKQIKVGQLNDEGKAAVSTFLEQNSEVQFKGLGGQKGEDFRKELIIQDQMEKLQKYSGLSPAEAEKKAKENVEQGFSKTKEEGRLQEQLINLVKGQGEASNALQKLLAQDDPLKTNMLAEENSRFLSELGSILTQNLVNQETVKKEQAQGVLDKAKNAASLPKIEDIQNAQAVSQINSEVKTKTDNALIARDEKIKTFNEGISAIKNNKEYQFGDSGALNSKGQQAMSELAQKVLGSPQEDLFISDTATGPQRSFSLDKAGNKIKNKLIESSNLELSNSVNPIIDRRKGLRPVDPSLQDKTPAELQDMLDRKKAAPSEAEVRGARNQVDTSNRSIQALQGGKPISTNGNLDKARGLARIMNNAIPNLGDINLGNGLTASSISEKIRQSQSRPSLVQRAMSATQSLDTGSVSKVNEIKDGLVGIMNSSVNGLNSFASNFNSTIEKLSGLEMNLNGNHKVEIVFNGAEMLGKLTPEIEAMVVNKTKEALNKFASDNFPNIPRQV